MPEHAKCKITVIKRSLNQDIIDAYLKEEMKGGGLCSTFKEGDEFDVYSEFGMPENFCHWAWADIRKDIIAVINNVQYSWFSDLLMTVILHFGCAVIKQLV